MQWYLSSRTSKSFQSFNEDVHKKFEETASIITERIEDMYKESGIGGLAMLNDIQRRQSLMEQRQSLIGADVQDIKAELFRQRQQPLLQQRDLGFDVRNLMRQTMLADYEEVTFKYQGLEYTIRKFPCSRSSPLQRSYLYHREARSCSRLALAWRERFSRACCLSQQICCT